MGNLATQHAYIQSMLNLPRFISILVLMHTIYGVVYKYMQTIYVAYINIHSINCDVFMYIRNI
jgi:hypothetical protein